MSYYQQQNRPRLTVGQDGNALTMLVAINLIVFVILAFVKVIYYFHEGAAGTATFNRHFFEWITLPADTEKLLARPWTLITHMFVHDTDSIWHILGNLLWLWAFGYILQDLAGNRKLVPVFIYSALLGALAYLLAFNLIGPLQERIPTAHAFGASAGVMGIAIAATTLSPNYKILTMLNGGIPIWIITVLFLVIDLATIPASNTGGHIAHIAGGFMGFVFILFLKKGHDIGLWMNQVYDWFTDLFNPDKPPAGKSVKSQLFYKAGVRPFSRTTSLTQQRVDEILDKISQKGYSALTEDEKEILKRASKEDI